LRFGNVNAGSWLAQQGDRGLRCGGISGEAAVGSRSNQGRRPSRTATPTPKVPPSGDAVGDSLDELLASCQASLNLLEKLRRNNFGLKGGPTASNPLSARSSSSPSSSGKPIERGSKPGKQVNDFWNPRCNPNLWHGNFDDYDLLGDLDESSEESTDSESEDFTFLYPDSARRPPSRATNPARSSSRSGFRKAAARPPVQPQAKPTEPPDFSAAGTGLGPGSKAGYWQPPSAADKKANQGAASGSRKGTERKAGAAPGAQHKDPPSSSIPRGQEAGFRFGGQQRSSSQSKPSKSSVPPPPPSPPPAPQRELSGPEREVASKLAAASQAGPEELKSVLKRLLLKWHPDKAPQGDGASAIAAREEATRVLRFVLSERARLGI